MAQTHEQTIHVQPTVNIEGQVNLAEIRKAYLKNMKRGILTLTKRYKLIIKKLKDAADPSANDKLKEQIEKLKEKLKLVKSKLDSVRHKYHDALAQVKKEKAETKEIKDRIKKTKADAMKTIKSLRRMIAKLRHDQSALIEKAALAGTIKKLKSDIKNVRAGVKVQLKKHHKDLADKIAQLHDRWTRKREELEDAWAKKEKQMKAKWAEEKEEYEETIARLRREGKCDDDEIFNVRTKECVKLNERKPAKAPKVPKAPKSKFGEFSASLKKTKETMNKMNKALKKMAEKERM